MISQVKPNQPMVYHMALGYSLHEILANELLRCLDGLSETEPPGHPRMIFLSDGKKKKNRDFPKS